MQQVLEPAAAGKVRVICETYPLEEATNVLAKLKRGEVRARTVLVV